MAAPIPGPDANQSVQYLEYPSNIGSDIKHWISFTGFDFKTKAPTLNIALYIPGDALNTSYKSDYDTGPMGSLGAAAPALTKAIREQGGLNVEAFKQVMDAGAAGLASEGKKVMLLKAGAGAEGKGMTGAKSIMERDQGAVLNPYIVAAYKGPTELRAHEFTFQMLPQSEAESRTCTKIATAFKTAMLPSHRGGDSQTAPSMLFGYPDEFEITFKVNGEPLPDAARNPLFKIGRSVLTGCDLDFATENVPLFFDKTQYPVSIAMKLSFMELEVMHREKIAKGF